MNIRRWATVVAGALVVLVICGATLSVTAAPQAAPVADPMAALLVEVHALRVAMERSGTVTPRVQLTLAQLNIKEDIPAKMRLIAEASCAEGETIHNMPGGVSPDQVYAALLVADQYGQRFLQEWE